MADTPTDDDEDVTHTPAATPQDAPRTEGSLPAEGSLPTEDALLTEDTIQTEEMKKAGIIVNTALRLAICLGCRVAIRPGNIYNHVARVHSLPITHRFCEGLATMYNLDKEPMRPGKLINAIFGLDIFPDYFSCDNCGAAFQKDTSVVRHHREVPSCNLATHTKRPAQSYNAGSNRMFFGVTVPTPPPSDPRPDPVFLIKNSYSPTPFQAVPIQAVGFRDANHFLAIEKWADHVDGMTGEEIYHIVREREPELRELVRDVVIGYANDAVQALGNEEHSVKVAIGDYNGYVKGSTFCD